MKRKKATFRDVERPRQPLQICGVIVVFEDGASSSQGRIERRLISLIFAGRNRIIMIRRALPLTSGEGPAEPVT